MGTHPIFESDFDCLTDSVKSAQWSLATRRPERCAVTCPTDKVVSVSTERVVTVVVAVWLVVNITTESTSTNTIPVISVKSVCDTSTSNRIQSTATRLTSRSCGLWFLRKIARPLPLIPPPPPSLTSLSEDSSRFLERDVSRPSPLSSKLDSFLALLRKKSRPPAESALLLRKCSMNK